MKRTGFLLCALFIFISARAFCAELTGYIEDAITKTPLIMAWSKAYDKDGTSVFSCTTPPGCVSPSGEYKAYPPTGLTEVVWCCDEYKCQTKPRIQ